MFELPALLRRLLGRKEPAPAPRVEDNVLDRIVEWREAAARSRVFETNRSLWMREGRLKDQQMGPGPNSIARRMTVKGGRNTKT